MPSLGNDLASIRKSQGLTIEHVHESTKIPKNILASIEDDSIFKTSGADAPYVRSYVRSYAKMLSIEEQTVVYALNRVKHGNYDGSLIDDDQRADQKEISTEKLEDREQEAVDEDQDSNTEKDTPKKDTGCNSDKPNPGLRSKEVDSIDWANLGYQFQPAKTLKSKSRYTIILGFILLAVVTFLIYWFYFKGNTSTNQNAEQNKNHPQTTTPSDSLQSRISPSASNDTANLSDFDNQFQEQQALPDTLSIVLYAAYDKLEPVRVYTDISDQLNPYWVERGEALKFNFVNEFHFRDGLSDIVLLINGHVIPNFEEQFLNPETGRIEISRSFFQEDSKWLQPPPDTLPIKAPPPSVVNNIED